jgi:hypothetical protein
MSFSYDRDWNHCGQCGRRLRSSVFCGDCGQVLCSWDCYLRHRAEHLQIDANSSTISAEDVKRPVGGTPAE